MNRKVLPLVVAVSLLSCLVAEANPFHPSMPPLPSDPKPQPSDLTADQLIARSEAARGGEQKLKAIQSVKMTGTWATQQAPNPHMMGGGGLISPSPVTVMIAPGRYLRRIEQGKGVPMVKAINGQETWELNAPKGILKPLPMVAKDAARFRHLADPQGSLVNAPAKGNKVEVVGKLSWKNSQVYKLKVTFRDGGVNYIYLDAKSFLPVRMVTTLYIPQSDKEIDIEFLYEDFRDVNGVKWPFVERANAPEGNLVQSISWDKIEVNVPLDEAAFKGQKS
jgi:hypothetical protein